MMGDGAPLNEERPSGAGRGTRALSRVLAVLGVLAVGAFGYLLGVRLSGQSAATSSQGGFGGPGGFGGAGSAGGQRAGRTAGQGASSGGSFAGRSGAGGSGQGAAGGRGAGFGAAGAGRSTVVSVQTAKVNAGLLRAQNQAAGSVVPLTQSNVASLVQGTVQRIVAPVGSRVSQGQAVVVLASENLQTALLNAQNSLAQARVNLATQTNANTDQRNQLQLQLNSAQAALATAQQNYQANLNLFKIGGIAQSELNTSKSALDTAQANLASAQNALATNARAKNETLAGLALSVQQAENSLKQAQQNLSNATVRAPYAGQVSNIPVNPGENVNAGGTVFTLVSEGRKVTFNVSPADATALHLGQTLAFAVGAQNYQVKLDQNPAAPVNGVVAVSARLLGESPPAVGSVGTVSYQTPVAQGVLVPSSALVADGTQNYVFLVEAGQAKRQDVTLLGQSGERSAVSGLPDGSEIIGSPPSGLLDGTRVSLDSGANGTSGGSFGAGSFGPGNSGSGNFGAGGRGAAGFGASGTSTSGTSTHHRRRPGAQGGAAQGGEPGAPANGTSGGAP